MRILSNSMRIRNEVPYNTSLENTLYKFKSKYLLSFYLHSEKYTCIVCTSGFKTRYEDKFYVVCSKILKSVL